MLRVRLVVRSCTQAPLARDDQRLVEPGRGHAGPGRPLVGAGAGGAVGVEAQTAIGTSGSARVFQSTRQYEASRVDADRGHEHVGAVAVGRGVVVGVDALVGRERRGVVERSARSASRRRGRRRRSRSSTTPRRAAAPCPTCARGAGRTATRAARELGLGARRGGRHALGQARRPGRVGGGGRGRRRGQQDGADGEGQGGDEGAGGSAHDRSTYATAGGHARTVGSGDELDPCRPDESHSSGRRSRPRLVAYDERT